MPDFMNDEATSRLYDSSSEDETNAVPTPRPVQESTSASGPEPAANAPLHPMVSFQDAFNESIIESIDEQNGQRPRRRKLGAKARRQKMIEANEYDETYSAQWRRTPQAKYHPLWKLMAQISFGVHLVEQRLARSDEEVVKILQRHVDEMDGFLDRTTEDLESSHQDIDERVNHLRLPLQHIDIFDAMLGDEKFRRDIKVGNDKIEQVMTRTTRATNDALTDVRKGLEAVAELSRYLDDIRRNVQQTRSQTFSICTAMSENAEGWVRCLRRLQTMGTDLGSSLARLGSIWSTMVDHAVSASRRVGSHPKLPVISAPTSRFSSAYIANAHGKPLPKTPPADSPPKPTVESPTMISTLPGSKGRLTHLLPPSPQSPEPRVPSFDPTPLTSLRASTLKVTSPLASSTQPTSPTELTHQGSAPFEGKFESAREAPKPPARSARSSFVSEHAGEGAKDIQAHPQDLNTALHQRTTSLPSQQSNINKSSDSFLKRLSRSSSKAIKGDTVTALRRTSKKSSGKHQRTLTTELADLLRDTGMSDSPHQSYVSEKAELMDEQSDHVSDVAPGLLSIEEANDALKESVDEIKPTDDLTGDSTPPEPPNEDFGLETPMTYFSTSSKPPERIPMQPTSPPPPPPSQMFPPPSEQPLSPDSIRSTSPHSLLNSSKTTPRPQTPKSPPVPANNTSPISLIQPSLTTSSRAQSPADHRPQTPRQGSKLSLFPTSRPMTPTRDRSLTPETYLQASPGQPRKMSQPSLFASRATLDPSSSPGPEVARSRAFSSAASSMLKTGELVGGATIVGNGNGNQGSSEEKKKGGLRKLKGWVSGRREKVVAG